MGVGIASSSALIPPSPPPTHLPDGRLIGRSYSGAEGGSLRPPPGCDNAQPASHQYSGSSSTAPPLTEQYSQHANSVHPPRQQTSIFNPSAPSGGQSGSTSGYNALAGISTGIGGGGGSNGFGSGRHGGSVALKEISVALKEVSAAQGAQVDSAVALAVSAVPAAPVVLAAALEVSAAGVLEAPTATGPAVVPTEGDPHPISLLMLKPPPASIPLRLNLISPQTRLSSFLTLFK